MGLCLFVYILELNHSSLTRYELRMFVGKKIVYFQSGCFLFLTSLTIALSSTDRDFIREGPLNLVNLISTICQNCQAEYTVENWALQGYLS